MFNPDSVRSRFAAVAIPLMLVASPLFVGCGSVKPDAGAGGAGGSGQPDGGVVPSGLAIVSSDYSVTSIATYDLATGSLRDDCVRSGVTSPVLAQELSGDVVLPSAPQERGELVVIDRKNAVLTFVAPTSCMPRAQLSVSTGGFKSNPHDVVSVSTHKAYVVRYDANLAPTSDPSDFDEGDDLLVIDPSIPMILGRVPLSGYAATTGAGFHANPDRALLVGGLVYVTLNNLGKDAAGPGRLVIIDPATDTVTGVVDLPDLTGCSGLSTVESTRRLYVSCGGEFTDADQVAKSALVEIDLSGAAPVVSRVITAHALGSQPISYFSIPVLGETAFIGTSGTFDPITFAMTAPDTFYAVPLGGAAPSKVLDGGAYNLGEAAVDIASKRVFLPDGDQVMPRVRILDASGATVVAGTPFEANPSHHLPPRQVVRY